MRRIATLDFFSKYTNLFLFPCLLLLGGSSATAQNTWDYASSTYAATGYTVAGVGTYYKGTSGGTISTTAVTSCNGFTVSVPTSSGVFYYQPAVDITAVTIWGVGTGNNRSFSSMQTSSTLNGTYTTVATASGTGTISSGACGSVVFTAGTTIPAGTFIKLTFTSGNVNITSIINSPAAVNTPTQQANTLTFSNVAQTSMTVGWTRGNGGNVAVFVKAGAGAITDPTDGSTYTANTTLGSGTQLGTSGYYCVYNGNGNSVSVSGLSASTTYYVQAYEYNGAASSSKYLTTTATGNPASQATLAPGADYRTVTSGDWSNAATWESYNGSSWVPAASAPGVTAATVTIRNGHTVAVAADLSVDELTVASGGTLNINNGTTLTIANGTGTDVTLDGTIKNSGTFTLNSGATMAASATGIYEDAQAATSGTITLPTATWGTGSTVKLTGIVGAAGTTPTDFNNLNGIGQTFSNFVIDLPNLIGKLVLCKNSGGLFAVNGTLTVNATGTSIYGVQLTSSGVQEGITVGNYVQNGGVVSIIHNSSNSTAKSLTVGGNFTLTSTAVFNISSYTTGTGISTLNVAGNLNVAAGATLQRNTSLGTGGTTNFVFNGTGAQTAAFGITNGVINYTLNNAAGLTLSTDLPVNGSLTLTAGKIVTGSNKVALSATGSITATATSYVVGNLQKNIATGATSATFEIGAADNYRPVTVAFGTVTTAGDLLATVSQTAGVHPNLSSTTINPNKSVNRYWTLTNSGIVYDNYSATFTFVAGDVLNSANTANFIIRRYSGGAWSAVTAGTLNTLNSQGTSITGFGDFAIGEAQVLPVVISSFKGETINASNVLSWATSFEDNNSGFQVERSVDGRNFSAIGFVASKSDNGRSAGALNYTFEDQKPVNGANYYRLKQMDKDGRYNYSSVVKLSLKPSLITISKVYPNPATDVLSLVITAPSAARISVRITDINGKVVSQSPLTLANGENMQQINVRALAPGRYFISLGGNEKVDVGTLTILKQ